ncbi:DUF4832 domain-containing protein [candidate division KSB1 bacterium]|nr:DUF4832 domain-containing protein [candidate division KSB1 bacterium]
MNTHRWIIAFIFIAVACLEAQTASKDEQRISSAVMVTIKPQEYPRPLRNPLKGFTNRGRSEDNEWATLMHSYIKWNEIERDSLDDIPEIKAWCASNWAGVENKNMKVIPRVYLHWDGDLTYWPDDMETYDYTSPQFVRRLRKMIWKLGECWDTDPRVAHIEMGIIGKWGEHHSPSPSKEVERILGDGFRAAFPHKKVLVRHPWEFAEYQFGIYWDSWAHQDQMSSHGQAIYNLGDRWKTEVIGGETAYNWGNWKIQPGDDPTDTMVDPVHRDFFIYTIRWLHCAQLRWVADYDQNNAAARAGAEEVQKAFGYRYVIDDVTYPSRIEKGGEFAVSFSGRNTGSAPFYYDWPVELSLLDESNAVVWSADFDVDIRTWLPGDKWKKSDSLYTVPAEPFSAHGTFVLDADLPVGQYKLALAVLDPAGRLPSLRFAIKNYLAGGRHPIGYIGVGMDAQAELDTTLFADPYRDKSLRYIFDPELVGVSGKSSPPQNSRLTRCYPNPFNQGTRIQYELGRGGHVQIAIYSVIGRRICTLVAGEENSGSHTVVWDGRDEAGDLLASGLYFITLTTDDFSASDKIIFAK